MPDMSKSDKTKAGVHYAYPAATHQTQDQTQQHTENVDNELKSVPLEDLMSKLKNL